MKYNILLLDVWGHVPADCKSFGCSCIDEHGRHDDNTCDCYEDVNNWSSLGYVTIPDDATDADIISALSDYLYEGDYVVDDYSDGLLIQDSEGRKILELDLVQE